MGAGLFTADSPEADQAPRVAIAGPTEQEEVEAGMFTYGEHSLWNFPGYTISSLTQVTVECE